MGGMRAAAAGVARRTSAPLACIVVLLLVFQSLAFPAPQSANAAFRGIGAVSTIGVDCAAHDVKGAPEIPRPHDCPLTGLCCVACCDGPPQTGVETTASSEILWTGSAAGHTLRIVHAQGRIVPAGGTRAWSSRAPPRAA